MARGDWDDVVAAAYFAVRDQEVAILSVQETERAVEFELLSIRDEPGRLVARRGGDPASPESITVSARVGSFGDVEREKRLLNRFSRRLADLSGVDYRPAR